MVTISNRDEKMIIWSFMEELCDKYFYASENNLTTDFNINEFCNMDIFSKYLYVQVYRVLMGRQEAHTYWIL
jgi:hypothetical protein